MTVNSPKTKWHGNSAQVVVPVRRCEIDHAQSWSSTSAASPRFDNDRDTIIFEASAAFASANNWLDEV
jgi:hypothetical protein